MLRVRAEMGNCAREGLLVKEAENAAGGVRIGGGRLKISPRAVRKRTLGIPSARDIEGLRGTKVS